MILYFSLLKSSILLFSSPLLKPALLSSAVHFHSFCIILSGFSNN